MTGFLNPMMSDDPDRQDSPLVADAPTSVAWGRVENFVGQVSHDLRNGLNACELQLTYLAEISADPEAKDEVKQLRQTLAGMTKQLQALRTAVSGATAHAMDYPAADLFEDLRERFVRQHARSASRVVWKTEVGATQTILIDPEITLSAAMELLANAQSFAPAATPITCAIVQAAPHVLLSVEQTMSESPGDPLDHWGVTPLVSTRRGAYGLGLFRVRRALQAQGSTLKFAYAPETGILTATIRLVGVV